MRVCPKCGFVDSWIWRATTWHSTQGNECCRACDLEIEDPQLLKKIVESKGTFQDEHYAYRITKTRVWVIRRWLPIFKIQGWKDVPAESHHKPKTAGNEEAKP